MRTRGALFCGTLIISRKCFMWNICGLLLLKRSFVRLLGRKRLFLWDSARSECRFPLFDGVFSFLHCRFLPSCAVVCAVRTIFYCLINGNGKFSIFPLQMPTIAEKAWKKQKTVRKTIMKAKNRKRKRKNGQKGRFIGWIRDCGGQKRHENNEKVERKPNAEKSSTRGNRYLKWWKVWSVRKEGKKSRKP